MPRRSRAAPKRRAASRTRYSRSRSRATYQPRRSKRRVSRRAASSRASRPSRIVIELRQAPAEPNPIEGILAAAKRPEKERKAQF